MAQAIPVISPVTRHKTVLAVCAVAFSLGVTCYSDGQITGTTAIPPNFKPGRYGYIDTKGRYVIPPTYGNAGNFRGGRAPVCVGGQWKRKGIDWFLQYADGTWGFINREGKMVIRPQFVDFQGKDIILPGASPFSENLALVNVLMKTGRSNLRLTSWAYIDREGNRRLTLVGKYPWLEANEINTTRVGNFSEGLARFELMLTGYMNTRGEVVIPFRYHGARDFHEGLAAVKIYLPSDGKTSRSATRWGLIDRQGKMVIDYRFEWAGDFSEGLASVQEKDKKVGFINQAGKYMLLPRFDAAGDFSEGLAPVAIPKSLPEGVCTLRGYIDKTGRTIISPRFDIAASFSEDLAAVKIKEKWGFIDKKGTCVIPPKFDWTFGFSEGLAGVWINDGK
jgi:hypothetical protein